ncbi:secreted protein [Rhodococcus sp. B7740]|nr:secreted protein [Rhodococcus sp. B7740]
MKMRNFSVAVALATAVMSVAGCSSADESDQTDHNSTSAAESSVPAADAPAVAPPTSGELEASLLQLVAPNVDAATKAASVENGQARLTNLETMTAALANYGAITFEVAEPTVEGETSTADVAIATPRGTAAPSPQTWVLIDGNWKLSDASTCRILAMGQAPCA